MALDINAHLDVLVEDVLPDFGVDSRQRIVEEVDVCIGIQRPGQVDLAATNTVSTCGLLTNIGRSIVLMSHFSHSPSAFVPQTRWPHAPRSRSGLRCWAAGQRISVTNYSKGSTKSHLSSKSDYLMLTSASPSSPRRGHKPQQPGCTNTLSSESQVRCSPSMWRWRSKPDNEKNETEPPKLRIVSRKRLDEEGCLLRDKSQRSVNSHLALSQLHLEMYLLWKFCNKTSCNDILINQFVVSRPRPL